MKKTLSWILLLALAFTLTACGNNPDPQIAANPTATADPLAAPTASALPLTNAAATPGIADDKALADPLADPLADQGDDFALDLGDNTDPTSPKATAIPKVAATPGPIIAIKDYVLVDYTDEALGITLKVPEHWIVESGTNTLTFVEPVESGKLPMRLAITVKNYDDEKLTAAQQKKQFTSFLNVVKEGYSKFKKGKNNNQLVFMNRASLSCNYMAKQKGDDTTIKGFVIMGNVTRTKQIVAMHFSAPQAKFKNSAAFRKTILYSIAPTAADATPTATVAPTKAPAVTDPVV